MWGLGFGVWGLGFSGLPRCSLVVSREEGNMIPIESLYNLFPYSLLNTSKNREPQEYSRNGIGMCLPGFAFFGSLFAIPTRVLESCGGLQG